MNKMTGYLLIALLGIASWPIPASANGANSGPTCDEITSGYICDGQFVPELVVTADRVVWTAPTSLADYLALLEHDVDQLSAFISASVANVIAAQNQYGNYQPSASRISQAQGVAEEVLEVKKKMNQVSQWFAENSPSCQALSDYGVLLGAVIIAGSTQPFSFPGVVVGFTLAYGGFYSEHFVCS